MSQISMIDRGAEILVRTIQPEEGNLSIEAAHAILTFQQQFPEACKSQHSSSIPTCLFVNLHAKMGLS